MSQMHMDKRFPFPGIPSGWYAIAYSHDVRRGQVASRKYFGRELVVFRTESGQIHVNDPYCPHLGAHLGQGSVQGERLRCPFHGFQFDGSGKCVATAYGTKPPPTARLGTWPVVERNGAIMVWHDALGRSPWFQIPELDHRGWTATRGVQMRVATHPQETTENGVDFGHLNEVHGFGDPAFEQQVSVDGPVLRAGYSITRGVRLPAVGELGVRAHFYVTIYGLGFSLVRGEVPRLGLHFRHIFFSTPIDEEHVDLRLTVSARKVRVPFVTSMFQAAILGSVWHEVSRDAAIWERKRYVERPALAKGDGPIPAYRRWARQFYPPSNATAVAAAE